MRTSLVASFGLHVFLLIFAVGWMLLGPAAEPIVMPQQTVPVEIITSSATLGAIAKKQAMVKTDTKKSAEKPSFDQESDVTKPLTQNKAAAKEEAARVRAPPKPEPTTPEPAPKPEPTPPKPEPVAEPTPPDKDALKEILAEETAAAEAEAAEKKKIEKVELQKKAEALKKKLAALEKKKAEEEKKKKAVAFDPGALDDLLNKDSKGPTSKVTGKKGPGKPNEGDANMQGDDAEIANTLGGMLAAHLKKCWVPPPGSQGVNVTVVVGWHLNRDGTLNGEPTVVEGDSGHPLYQAMANAAIRAVKTCQKYDFFPADKYDMWKDPSSGFNPREQGGG